MRDINEHNPVTNKNLKLFGLLHENYLKEDTPLQIIPKVLVFLRSMSYESPSYELGAIFRFMKEWSMPLLYTNRRLGKDPRRSDRIRKKKVMKYMGKK